VRRRERRRRRLTRDEDAWHVFIAAWDDDGGVEVVGSGGGLHGVGDEVAGLEGVGHAKGAHADAVADADGAVLVGDGAAGGEGVLDGRAHGEEVFVARVSLVPGQGERCLRGKKDIPDACDGDKGLAEVGVVVDGVGGVEHGLAGTMVLGLSDCPAVSVERGKGTSEHGGRPEKRRAGSRFNVVCGRDEGHP